MMPPRRASTAHARYSACAPRASTHHSTHEEARERDGEDELLDIDDRRGGIAERLTEDHRRDVRGRVGHDRSGEAEPQDDPCQGQEVEIKIARPLDAAPP